MEKYDDNLPELTQMQMKNHIQSTDKLWHLRGKIYFFLALLIFCHFANTWVSSHVDFSLL